MPFIASIISGVVAVGGAVMANKNAKKANDQSAANQAEAGRVDYTTMSPEAKKVLQGLFGSAGALADKTLSQDFNALRVDNTQEALKAALTNTLNSDIPGLKSAMGKAGAYNSTSFGIAANDAITSAQAKAFYASQAATNETIKTQLEMVNPLLALLNIDKGAQKVGKEVTGIANAISAGGVSDAAIGAVGNSVGKIFDYFTKK